jgi:hypothetical protein
LQIPEIAQSGIDCFHARRNQDSARNAGDCKPVSGETLFPIRNMIEQVLQTGSTRDGTYSPLNAMVPNDKLAHEPRRFMAPNETARGVESSTSARTSLAGFVFQ